MPVYEYVCLGCTREFEKYVSSWGEAATCPACQSGDVQKQVSAFAMTGTDGVASGGCGCGRGGCGCRH